MEGSSSLVVESGSHGKGACGKEKEKKAASGRGIELPPGSISCIDCGNQAKKECCHRRCRTCCTGRGLPCPTHVKSTWVPAAKRRERQMGRTDPVPAPPKRTRNGAAEPNTTAATATATVIAATNINNSGGASSNSSGMSPKAPEVYSVQPLRVLPPPPHPPTAPSFTKDECSGCGPPPLNVAGTEKLNKHAMSFEAANLRKSLPSELRAQALFKCVIVTGLNDEKNEYAYQTSVKIGGHIFRGMLYDQGIDAEEANVQVGENVVSSSFFHNSEAYGSSGNSLKGKI